MSHILTGRAERALLENMKRTDAGDWDESKYSRDADGKFGEGGGSGGKASVGNDKAHGVYGRTPAHDDADEAGDGGHPKGSNAEATYVRERNEKLKQKYPDLHGGRASAAVEKANANKEERLEAGQTERSRDAVSGAARDLEAAKSRLLAGKAEHGDVEMVAKTTIVGRAQKAVKKAKMTAGDRSLAKQRERSKAERDGAARAEYDRRAKRMKDRGF